MATGTEITPHGRLRQHEDELDDEMDALLCEMEPIYGPGCENVKRSRDNQQDH